MVLASEVLKYFLDPLHTFSLMMMSIYAALLNCHAVQPSAGGILGMRHHHTASELLTLLVLG